MTDKKLYSEEEIKICFEDFIAKVQSAVIKASTNINKLEANLENIPAMKIRTDAIKIIHDSFTEVANTIDLFSDISFENYVKKVMIDYIKEKDS